MEFAAEKNSSKEKYFWIGAGILGLGYLGYRLYTQSRYYLARSLTDEDMIEIYKLLRKKLYQEDLYLAHCYVDVALHRFTTGIMRTYITNLEYLDKLKFANSLKDIDFSIQHFKKADEIIKEINPKYHISTFDLRHNWALDKLERNLDLMQNNEFYKLVSERYNFWWNARTCEMVLGVIRPENVPEFFDYKKCFIYFVEERLDNVNRIKEYLENSLKENKSLEEIKENFKEVYRFIGTKEYTKRRLVEELGEEFCEGLDYDPLYYVECQSVLYRGNNRDQTIQIHLGCNTLREYCYSMSFLALQGKNLEDLRMKFQNSNKNIEGEIVKLMSDLEEIKNSADFVENEGEIAENI